MSNEVQEASGEKAELQMRLIRDVSLELITRIALLETQIAEFRNRSERQQRDLNFALTATANASPEEKARASRLQSKLEATQRALGTFDQTANILAGALFQVVKQAMSIVHGSMINYPNPGRLILGVKLSDIVWQARNQAMHFEETKAGSTWVATFAKLNEGLPGSFTIEPPYVSRAKAVFDLLGWQNYSTYEVDVLSLLSGRGEL